MDYDPWKVFDTEDVQDSLAKRESLFSLANGFLGFRGFYEERTLSYHPGVFVNGFYETERLTYGEKAYAFPEYNQTMVDLPDARFVQVYIDDQLVDVQTGTVHEHRRVLDMRQGSVERYLDWESPAGSRLHITWKFLVSYAHHSFAALRVWARLVKGEHISVYSTLAVPSGRTIDSDDPRVRATKHPLMLERYIPQSAGSEYWPIAAELSMPGSGKVLVCGAVHGEVTGKVSPVTGQNLPGVLFSSEKENVGVTKLICYETKPAERSQIYASFDSLLDRIKTRTFSAMQSEQQQLLDSFWEHSKVFVPENPHLEQALRFNLFQLFQSVGKDGRRSLAAKGLTGAGYEGHYFWDTEIYALPVLTLTQPNTARALLAYRIKTIPQARIRAAQLSQRGILFPWRTINGEEVSPYFPAGTAQYHINADIAYSLLFYLRATDDISILAEGGAELLFETARFWYDLGFFSERAGNQFCIHEVTGPDEYTALVNNNLYTNVMAQYNLAQAEQWYNLLSDKHPHLIRQLEMEIGLASHEPQQWREAAQRMRLPFDREYGIHPQDDHFLERERWDFETRPKDKYPLLLHYHPLVIYRYQVLKQADVVLAHVLLPEAFPWFEKVRDYHYYEQLTTGDSSLSACMQGIMAIEAGDVDKGYDYLLKTARMDLDDHQGNVKDGLHTAAMAGSWLLLVYGFAGLRCTTGELRFAPTPFAKLGDFLVRVTWRGCLLEVFVGSRVTEYRLVTGEQLRLFHHGAEVLLTSSVSAAKVPSQAPFAAAIFDLDGVITSTDRQHYQAWKQLSDELSLDFDEELNQQLRGVSRRECLQIIGKHNGRTFTEEEMQQYTDRKNGYYRQLLEDLTDQALLPGFVSLCKELKSHGISIGVASASRNAPFIVEKLGIGSLIDVVAPASEVIVGKPDPEVFVRCAQLLGVSRGSCVGFEDAAVGIEALKRARMRTVGVGKALQGIEADCHVESLEQLSYKDLAALWTD
ncbi:MAG: beta-phosphoglucomutase [Spirochaetota bacterium]